MTGVSLSTDWSLSHDWQLDSYAYHVTPRKEWFSTFSARRQEDVRGVGEIHLQFAGGGSLVLQGVRYMPDARRSQISIPQLRESDCQQVTLTEQLFTLWRGQLVLTKGCCGTRRSFLHVLNVKDQSLVVSPLPFRGAHPRRVQFATSNRGH